MSPAETLLPLAVVVPLALAAALAAADDHMPRRVPDALAVLASAFVTVVGCVLFLASRSHHIVYWFGGWEPRKGLALGVDFVVEPVAAALVGLAGAVVTCVLVFSWRYFEEVKQLFHTLVLVLLAGMVGFALSGDLFNVFVWLELLSVAAYGLCGYQVQRPAAIQGAFNFAVVNSVAAFTMLFGIALVYARTGTLNLSQIGETLARRPPDGLVAVAFTMVAVGLLVKAGAVPFHFWLSDAYAVAPAPVGAVFAGVMTDLAYHVFARVYWDGFADALHDHETAVRTVLVVVAVLTALVGGVMCFLQADLKRQMAFLSISHGGVVLAGVALLDARGLAGSVLHTISSGLLRAALFLTLAVIIQTHDSDDELWLRGRGHRRESVLPAVLFGVCALGLAALPQVGTFLSGALLVDAPGWSWLPPVLLVSSALGAATVLRAGARIFLGWGEPDDPLLTRQNREQAEPDDEPDVNPGRRRVLLVAAVALVLMSFGAAAVPAVGRETVAAAQGIEQPRRTAAEVLHGAHPPVTSAVPYSPSPAGYGYGAGCTALAVALAALGLWWRRATRRLPRVVLAPVRLLKAAHDGVLPDYVLWFSGGLAALALVWLVSLVSPG